MSDSLLPSIEVHPANAAQYCVIWLHGLGADGHDFEPIVPELHLAAAVRFVFPHAPRRPVTVNGGYVMRAWYDIYSGDLGADVDEAGIADSVQQIERLIDKEIAQGIPTNNIILAGFSQGGVIALATAAHYPQPLAGVLALSCYVAQPEQFPAAKPTLLPIFMAHGTRDAIVPYPLALDGYQTLINKGYSVEWHEYAMEHSVCGEEIRDIETWLGNRCQ